MKPRIHHIAVAVESIDEALTLYQDILDIEPGPRTAVPHEQVEVVMLQLGDSRIELLEPTSAESPVARFLAKRGPGLHHIALQVQNLQPILARLEARSASLAGEGIQRGAEGYRYVFVHPQSAAGALLELIETED
jgi:methylmalonyl-CoA epimerase